ncbi:class I SAM-dependent methyltransferase [Paenibacillus thermotolerans]|uniref:class I SAM-dependent methyltransferase n=1 Tax=Paenibacillus thermotolerans TaxID=3027807 RepID=UPI002368A592|nr:MULTISPECIES: class I SAM-dependent methyltransferase [unclassified Paenibacillus]
MEKQKQIRIFDKQARQYDRRRENPKEARWRQQLIRHAKGEVLEIAVGAGANFPYYTPGVKVTATDFSEAMLEKAKQAAARYRLDAQFIRGDMDEMDFPDQSFDSVVSTLSMCSYADPLTVLKKLNRWCKPGGNILLMEHGISTNAAVSAVQKTLNPMLYRLLGCHHTRDIPGLVRAAGIDIAATESYWFDMVHLIWAKPNHPVMY